MFFCFNSSTSFFNASMSILSGIPAWRCCFRKLMEQDKRLKPFSMQENQDTHSKGSLGLSGSSYSPTRTTGSNNELATTCAIYQFTVATHLWSGHPILQHPPSISWTLLVSILSAGRREKKPKNRGNKKKFLCSMLRTFGWDMAVLFSHLPASAYLLPTSKMMLFKWNCQSSACISTQV